MVLAAGAHGAPSEKAMGRAAQILAAAIPRVHLAGRPVDDTVGADALDRYLASLDGERVYFLASDVEEFNREATRLDDQLRAGDFSFARRVFERLRERVADRVAYAGRLLDEGFDVTVRETYRWRRKDAPWAADRAAWDELWRLRVKNDYVARCVTARLAEEEKQAAASGDGAAPGPDPAVAAALDEDLDPAAFVRKRYDQFRLVLEDADEQYVLERFLNAFALAYDPHSAYLSPSQRENFDISMKLSLVGIGAMLNSEDGAAKIVRLIPGGPAERDGRLQPGDKIIAVAQGDEAPVDVLHWPLYKTVGLIRGEKNTRVVLTILPASDPAGATEERIDLVRDEVKLEEQAARAKVREVPQAGGGKHAFGVIVLPEFYADFRGAANGEAARRASEDVRRELASLTARGIDGLVLDLRNNGGGSLQDAVMIAGLFIESGPIVQVKDRRGVHVLSDPDPEQQYAGPLVVLVNRMSASASEIVAAALQDYARAVVVGDRQTHGKGTVQSLMPLDRRTADYGNVKLTTASFYRIAGGSTQLRGVRSDIWLPSALDAMELGEEYLDHAMPWSAIEPAFYAQTGGAPLEELERGSERRREADARFADRRALLNRVAERLRAETITLHLEDRLAMSRDERKLGELQRRLEQEPRRDARDDDEEEDLVLEEALRILDDWANAAEPEQPVVAGTPVALAPAPLN